MAKRGKGELGKTKRYSNLTDTVKSSAVQQEPIPRIPLEKIKKIYDEYGFNQPDGAHVQEKLPNDESKLRSILDVHRKVLDEEISSRADKKISDMKYQTELHKQNQKNHLDAMKRAAKAQKDGMMTGGATGGPGFSEAQPMQMPPTEQPIPDQRQGAEQEQAPGLSPNQTPLDISNAGEAFFVGEFALVKLLNPGVQSDKSPIWLIDVKNKVLRPFMSQKAFDAYFGASQEAYDAVITLPSSAVSEGGPLAEFKMMNGEFGIKDDGSMRTLDHSPAMIQRRYGKPVDENAENRTVMALDGMLKKARQPQGSQPSMDPGMMGGESMATGGPGFDGTGGPGLPTLNISRNLEPKMSGSDVKSLQEWLIAGGFLAPNLATGYYGDLTTKAVSDWQKSIGLDAGQYPGYFGPRSLAASKNSQQTVSQGAQTQTQPTTQVQSSGASGSSGTQSGTPQTGSGTQSGTSTGLPYNRVTSDGLPLSKTTAASNLSKAFDTSGATTTISPSMIEKIKNDPTLLAFYISALTYGGYTLGEVFKDIKRRELISSGHSEYENVLVISGDKTREEYAQTDEGRTANTLPEFAAMKPGLNNVDPSLFDLPLYDIPADAFKQLIPILDPTTPEFKAEIEKIQSVMHDVQVAMINAKTEQEKSAAEYEYEKFKTTIERTYGIQLSNNANEAWKQIETLGTSYANAGISNSGMQNEAVDETLKNVRQRDNNSRETKLSEEESKQAVYFSKYGTPDEIKKLISEDVAKGLPRDQWRATKWGLVPSQDVLNSLDLSALKTKYPDKTDEELKRLRDGIIDENGNYRSDLYQRKQNSLETERVTDLNAKTIQYTEAQKQKEAAAYKEYTTPDNPYIRPKIGETAATPVNSTTQAAVTSSGASDNSQLAEWKKNAVSTYGKGILSMNTTWSWTPEERAQIESGTYPGMTPTPQQTQPAAQTQMPNIVVPKSLTTQGSQTQPQSTPTTQQSTPSSSSPSSSYTGVSIVDYLSSTGKANDFASRSQLASANGITGYTGTADQNTALLKKLRGY